MNKNEISELKRRFKFNYNAIGTVYGTYVNGNREIISSFDASFGMTEQEETEMYLGVLKKVLSGTLGKNLLDIGFTTAQVEHGEEHDILMKLKNTWLKDADARNRLIQRIIESLDMGETNYLILMAADAYDVPYRDKNDELPEDSGDEVYSYFVCAICPVKAAQLQLRYDSEKGEFHSLPSGQIALAPELGFLFPAFDDRSSNIYNALYYVHKPKEIHREFIENVFGSEEPLMSAPEQRDAFNETLAEVLEEELDLEVLQSMNEMVRDRLEVHRIEKDPEPLKLSAAEVGELLTDSGVTDEKAGSFVKELLKRFGDREEFDPQNLMETKKFSMETPEVLIRVDAENSHIIETRVIDGRKYILIPADSGVEINGINVSIKDR